MASCKVSFLSNTVPDIVKELSSYSVGWSLTAAVYSPTHNLLITAGKWNTQY
jgi:hypothetical protein